MSKLSKSQGDLRESTLKEIDRSGKSILMTKTNICKYVRVYIAK